MNVRERHETQCHVESGVFIVPLIVMVIYIYIYIERERERDRERERYITKTINLTTDISWKYLNRLVLI